MRRVHLNCRSYVATVLALLIALALGALSPRAAMAQSPLPEPPNWVKTAAASTQLTVSWCPVPNATSYTVTRGVNGGTAAAYLSGVTYTSVTNTGLTNGSTYKYNVTAVNSNGSSTATSATGVPASTVLAATSAIETSAGDGSLSVTWAPVSAATLYYIYRATTTGGEGTTPVAVVSTNTYADNNLANGTTYYYKVTAANANGEGTASNEATGSPGGLKPAAVAWAYAVAGSGQATLTWAANPQATAYEINIGQNPVASGITGTSYTITGLTNSTAYTFTIYTATADGIGGGYSVTATPGSTLAAPSTFTATGSNGSVALAWSTVTGASGYSVYRSTSTGTEANNCVLFHHTGTSYTDVSVANGTTYYYVVSAYKSATDGTRSSEASATPTSTVPATPTNLKAIAGSTDVSLAWATVPQATSYTIGEGSTSVGPFTTLATGITGNTYDATGLTPGTHYFFAIAAVNTGGSSASGIIGATPFVTPLTAPTSVSTAPAATQITVTWSPVTGARSYNLYRSTTVGGEGAVPYVTMISSTSYTDTGLSNGTTYYYEVAAVNWSGEGSLSAEVSGIPSTNYMVGPAQLSATAGTAQIVLNWTSVPNATSYQIECYATGGTPAVVATGVTATTYTATGLTNGTNYSLAVISFYGAIQGGAASVVATPQGTGPAAPSYVALTAHSGYLTLTWTAVSGETFNIYRSTTSGGEGAVPIANTAGGTFNDLNLTNGTTYYYNVTALNSVGEGSPSAEVSGVPGVGLLPAPTGFQVQPEYGYVSVGWNSVSGATGYAVLSGGTVSILTGNSNTTWTVESFTSGTSYSFQVVALNGSVEGYPTTVLSAIANWLSVPAGVTANPGYEQIELGELPAVAPGWSVGASYFNLYRSTTSGGEGSTPWATGIYPMYDDLSLADGTTYYYQVTAVDFYGRETPKSVEVSATTLASSPPVQAVQWVNATAGSAQVSLSWIAASGASSYNIYRGTSSGGESTTPIYTGVTSTAQVDTGLTNGTTYFYYVVAVSGTGSSGPSDENCATPSTVLHPSQPTNLTATAGNGQISLSWTAGTRATSYNVYRGTTSGGESTTAIYTGVTTTTKVNTGLTNGTAYYYTVVAVNGGGTSGPSNEASGSPHVAVPAAPTGLSAVPGASAISLSWTATSGATSYSIYRGTISGGESTTAIASVTSGTTYSDTGFIRGTTNWYVIKAVNAGGTGSASAEVSAAAAAAVPAVTANAGIGQVALTWSASAGAASYNVYRATTTGSEGASPYAVGVGSGWTNSGLTANTTYYYTVTAVNGTGLESAQSTETSATTAPLASTTISAAGGIGQVVVTWTSVTGAASYTLYGGSASGQETVVSSSATSPYTDSSLAANATRYYYVVAVNSASLAGLQSAEVSATTAPAAATLTLTPGIGQISVSWTSITGAAAYSLYGGSSSGGESLLSSSATSPYSNSGLGNNVTRYYYLVAVNAAGLAGASSAEVNSTTSPAAPTGLTAIAGNTQVALAWTGSSGATSYNVKRSATTGGPYTTIATGVTTTTYVDTSVDVPAPDFYDEPTYYYVVSAVGVSEGANSTEANATPYGYNSAQVLQGGTATLYPDDSDCPISGTWDVVSPTGVVVGNSSTTNGWNVANDPDDGTITITAPSTAVLGANYEARATETGGTSCDSVIFEVVPILAPDSFHATAGNTIVGLSWTSVTGASSYDLWRSTSSSGPYTSIATGLTVLNYRDTGLTNGTNYFYIVAAVTSSGSVGGSNSTAALPYATSLPYLVGAGGSATFSGPGYDCPLSGVWDVLSPSGTVIATNGSPNGWTVADTSSIVNISAPAAATVDINYEVRVQRTGFCDSAFFDVVAIAPPTNLTAAAGNIEVTLTWTTAYGATSYNVKRGTSSGGPYTTVGPNVTALTYIDTPLTNGTKYYYVVTAVKTGFESINSNEASATPIAPPTTPTSLAAASASDSQISLTWTGSTGATNYWIEQSPDGTTGWSVASETTAPSAIVGSLSAATTYYYRVRAWNASGYSAYSNVASATTAPAPPIAPVVSTVVAADSQVYLAWSAVPAVSTYKVYSANTSGGPYSLVAGSITATSYYNTGLTNGLTYYYVVTAVGIGGESPYSAQVSGSPTVATAVPSAPTNLTANGGNMQVTLAWTPVANAVTYNVKSALVTGGAYTTIVSGLTTPSYTDGGLTNGTTYYYVVSGQDAIGEGANSTEAFAAAGAYHVNCGPDPAVAPFIADQYFSGGSEYTYPNFPPDITALTSPAPESVYMSERYGSPNFTYTFPNLIVGNAYTVRLHIVERGYVLIQNMTSGMRLFNVAVNGAAVMTNFDTIAASGGTDIPVIEQFNTSADSSGNVTVGFTQASGSLYSPQCSGIEVIPGGSVPAAPTNLQAIAGTSDVYLSWFGNGTTSYTVKRSTTSGGPYTTITSGVTGTTYTDPVSALTTTYYYVVTGVNSVGEGPNSNQATTQPAFTVTANSASVSATAGASATSTAVVLSTGSFSGDVVLTLAGVPSGVTYWFSPATVTVPALAPLTTGPVPRGDGTLYFCVGGGVSSGTYPMTITGTSGNYSNTGPITLVVP